MTRVQIGSLEHLLPIFVAIIFTIWLIKHAKNNLPKNLQIILFKGITVAISLTVITYHFYKIFFGVYNLATDLPLYLCSFLALIIPIFSFYRKYWMYEVLLFLIIGGTLQGVITPDIAVGFPSFDYFRYWVVHLGLLLVMCYATVVFNFKPKLKSVFKSFFALQIYVVTMAIVNYILNANYLYLNQKPKSASLLDYFGEWPMYVIVVQLITIPYFLLIYLPFYLTSKKD